MKKWTIFFITLLFATMVYASDDKPCIGVAWIEKPTETYDAVCQVIRKAGGTPVALDQVLSPDLEYDKNGLLVNASDFHGALSAEAAKLIRCNTWQGSNVEKVMDGISAVIFPGGGRISVRPYIMSLNPQRAVSPPVRKEMFPTIFSYPTVWSTMSRYFVFAVACNCCRLFPAPR